MITLPPNYLVFYFDEVLEFCESHNSQLLSQDDRQFIREYRSLSLEAKSLYTRLLNRKGYSFHIEDCITPELDDTKDVIQILLHKNCLAPLSAKDYFFLFDKLTIKRLKELVVACRPSLNVSGYSKKLDLINLCQEITYLDFKASKCYQEYVSINKHEIVKYLLFISTGRLTKRFSDFVLRDIGIRRVQDKGTKFTSRFDTLDTAKHSFYLEFSCRSLKHKTTSELKNIVDLLSDGKFTLPHLDKAKNSLIASLAEEFNSRNQSNLYVETLSLGSSANIREKYIRKLYDLGKITLAKEILEDVISKDNELDLQVFASDFYSRKFGTEKLSYSSRILRSAETIKLESAYLGSPEYGAAHYLENFGNTVYLTENKIFTTTFALLFWDVLFDKEGVFSNQFDRIPSKLLNGSLYFSSAKELHIRAELLNNPDVAIQHMQINLIKSLQTPKSFFSRGERVFQAVQALVHAAKKQEARLGDFLIEMSKNFDRMRSGYPDLMCISREGICSFVEVKAPGDSIRREQISKMCLLNSYGFESRVLNISWQFNENQEYCVVDVETTGSLGASHRVTEFAGIRYRGATEIKRFTTLINPERRIPKSITKLTGISNEMVKNAPIFSEVADEIYKITKDAIFVAHSVNFDYGFIAREFETLGIKFRRPKLCTCSRMRKFKKGLPSYSLKSLTEHFCIRLENHHRAMCDAEATGELLRVLITGGSIG